MAKKLRRIGQLSEKATKMRNAALKASEATHGFGKISPFELAISWTNAENVVAPWGQGVRSSVSFFNDHAEDFPIATGDLNSFIRDTASKVKDQLGLDVVPNLRIGYGIEDSIMGGVDGGRTFGQYNHKFENYASHIDVFPDVIWDSVKGNGGNIDDLLNNVAETVSHEMRHMYQYEGNSKKKWGEKSKKYKEKHGMSLEDDYPDYKTYYNNPIEKDARKYEKKFRRRNIKDLKNNLQNRQSRLAKITQQKLQEQARLKPFKRGEGTWRIAGDNFDYGSAEFDLSGLDISNNSVDIQDSKHYRKLKKGEGTYRRKPKETPTQQAQQTQNNQNRTRINKNAAADNEEAINNLFNINPNNTGNSYSYDIPDEPDINQKEVDSFMERIFGSKDFDIRKASQNDINYWSNFTAEDIKDFFVDPSDFSNQDTLDEIFRRIDDVGEVSEAYKLTDKFMENNFGSKDFDITQDKDPSAWANLTDDDLEYAYESLLPDNNKSAREMILNKLKTIRDDAQNLVNNQTSNFNSGANFNQTNSNTNNYSNNNSSSNNTNTNTNTNSGGGSSTSGGGGASSGSGGSSNSTGGSSSSTKTHLYKRNGKMRQLSNGSSKYSANTKFKVNTNSGHLPRTSNKIVKTIGTMSALNTVFNVAGAVSDYKNARREGKGVVGATLKAGAEFALGEMLGLKGQLALFAVRAIPSAAIAGADMFYKESRRMNSAANQGVFGNAQFQDTQQLATMRQSGMEMAKMANYNLQQTLMGNEATYFHR